MGTGPHPGGPRAHPGRSWRPAGQRELRRRRDSRRGASCAWCGHPWAHDTREQGGASIAVSAALAAKPAADIAARALENVEKALTTDVYVRRQAAVVGTKTKPVVQETELHVNALGVLILGGAAAAVAGVGALLAMTARDRTVSRGLFNPGQLQYNGWYDAFNRTAAQNGWTREPGQLFYHRPKK